MEFKYVAQIRKRLLTWKQDSHECQDENEHVWKMDAGELQTPGHELY